MILKKVEKVESKQSKDYWEAEIEWTEDYSFLPNKVAGIGYHNDLLRFVMGLDVSHKKTLDLTDEQIQKTWKAYSITVTYPNDERAFGLNGNTRQYN